jgi:hypothetical protein
MNLQVTEKRKETLASMCDERARMLQDQFNVSMKDIIIWIFFCLSMLCDPWEGKWKKRRGKNNFNQWVSMIC